MNRLSAILLVLSCMVGVTSAWWDHHHHHHHVDEYDPLLSTMTVEEAFHIADADNDGLLTHKEWQARDDKGFPSLLEDYDKDNDQKISLDEFRNIEDDN